MENNSQPQPRQWLIALLLAFFLGLLGVHRFYMGKNVSGTIMLVITLASPLLLFFPLIITSIWGLIDFIRIIIGSMKCADGSDLVK